MRLSAETKAAFRALGKKGGRMRAKRMTKAQRQAAARHAARARWAKAKGAA